MGLPWIRLDTNLPMHDKIIELAGHGDRGLAAAFVYVSSLAYSGANTTDGFIAKGALPFIHGKTAHAKLLVAVRLWEPLEPRGWSIRNYGDRNLVGAAQQAINEALSEAGKKGAAARWGTTKANGHPNGPGHSQANGQGHKPPHDADRMGRPMRIDATDVTDVTDDLPRLKSASSSPERARGNRTEARREIEELTRTRGGGAA